jgi:hypothetical protein
MASAGRRLEADGTVLDTDGAVIGTFGGDMSKIDSMALDRIEQLIEPLDSPTPV